MKAKCNQCGKPAVGKYGNIPLCVDCHYKIIQANFMEQQIRHNQLSWLASNINFTEQALSAGTGGLVPPKFMAIPQPPSAGINYTHSNIQVSDSAIGVINPGTLYAINTSIDVMQSRGDSELAAAIEELTKEVVNSKDIQDDIKKEIAELLQFLASEGSVSKDTRNKSVIKQVLDRLCMLIPTAAAAWSIWERVKPLLQSLGG
jgi:hypothetical protein